MKEFPTTVHNSGLITIQKAYYLLACRYWKYRLMDTADLNKHELKRRDKALEELNMFLEDLATRF